MKKFQADKLEPKADKCIFIGHPNQLGIPPVSDPKAIGIVSRIRSFLEKEFLSKELSGRKIELDEVVEPLLQPESSAAQENVSVVPAPTGEEVNDDDQEASDQVTAELRRSTRTRSAPEWYGNPVLEICC